MAEQLCKICGKLEYQHALPDENNHRACPYLLRDGYRKFSWFEPESAMNSLDETLKTIWDTYKVNPNFIDMSYDVAKRFGVDVTGIPEGSVVRVAKDGISVVVDLEKGEYEGV